MSARLRVLFSARDPGSAGHVSALLPAFRADRRFEVDLVATGTAAELLREAGESPLAFRFDGERDHIMPGEDPSVLLDVAARLVGARRPDVVVASVSSVGAGLDEALLAVSPVPTFAMQDFWGDVNLDLGVPAELYFVLDDEAAALTQARWKVRARAVGSPKHARYAGLDVPALRHGARRALALSDHDGLIGFFGQSPAIPGHDAAFDTLVQALTLLPRRPRLLLRAHPKFPEAGRPQAARAAAGGVEVVDVTARGQVEQWLAACDAVTTPFSTCGLDHAYLSAYSPEPIGSALYLTNEPIRRFLEERFGVERIPLVDAGMGRIGETPDEVAGHLAALLGLDARRDYFEASKSLARTDAARAIVDTVAATAPAMGRRR